MKELGNVTHYLGLRVTQSPGQVTLDQTHYIEEFLKRFGMDSSKPVSTPSEKLSEEDCPADEEEKQKMSHVPYREAVGCLNYIAQSTRPDIVFAVNVLSRFCTNPGVKHWQGVKHLMRYLRGTSDYQLTYKKSKDDSIIGYSDADWDADKQDRISTTGFVFIAQGGAISWTSKKQHAVALSSCEAEYYALASGIQEALWWQGLRAELDKHRPIQMFCDNQSAIKVSEGNGFNPRLKHIDIRYKFVKDEINKGKIKLNYISTLEQPADVLTKGLDKTKTMKFSKMLGVLPSTRKSND